MFKQFFKYIYSLKELISIYLILIFLLLFNILLYNLMDVDKYLIFISLIIFIWYILSTLIVQHLRKYYYQIKLYNKKYMHYGPLFSHLLENLILISILISFSQLKINSNIKSFVLLVFMAVTIFVIVRSLYNKYNIYKILKRNRNKEINDIERELYKNEIEQEIVDYKNQMRFNNEIMCQRRLRFKLFKKAVIKDINENKHKHKNHKLMLKNNKLLLNDIKREKRHKLLLNKE